MPVEAWSTEPATVEEVKQSIHMLQVEFLFVNA